MQSTGREKISKLATGDYLGPRISGHQNALTRMTGGFVPYILGVGSSLFWLGARRRVLGRRGAEGCVAGRGRRITHLKCFVPFVEAKVPSPDMKAMV